MRIAMVTHKVDFHDGQGRVNYEIVQAALARGHHVTVIAEYCAPEIAMHPRGRFMNARHYRLPTQLLRNLYFAYTSARLLRKHRNDFDIVQANGFVTWERADVVAVHFVHSAWLRSAYYPFQWSLFNPYACYQRLFTLISSYCEKRTFRQANVLVAVSQFTAKEVDIYCGIHSGVIVVNNGVDTNEFFPGAATRESFGLPLDVPMALFVGDIRTSRKNLESVLRALQSVPRLHLVVAGKLKGSPYPALAAQLHVDDRVSFVGSTSRIADLMRSADFFVFPSRYEAQPLVLLEAMAAGLPVIVSGSFGAGDYVRDAGLILSDPDDVVKLVSLMKTLIDVPSQRQAMGAAARRQALEMQWSRTAEGYLRVYDRVMSTKNSSKGQTLELELLHKSDHHA